MSLDELLGARVVGFHGLSIIFEKDGRRYRVYPVFEFKGCYDVMGDDCDCDPDYDLYLDAKVEGEGDG